MAADHGGPGPDLYQLLGVAQGASREEITLAWRRRARAEHPDSHPGDTAALARFRALAEAYQVLSDPARRAAYDRVLGDGLPGAGIPAPGIRGPVRYPGGPRGAGPRAGAAGPPLRAGPVRVDGAYPVPGAGDRDEPDTGLAVLAELALRYLARERPW
ncbi:MAG TPA: J domain-containing protein [Streptosporangiaceae bacterium]|jgi:curved DNA-binding protein CbpA